MQGENGKNIFTDRLDGYRKLLDFDAASTVMMTVPAWQGLYAGAAASDQAGVLLSFAQKKQIRRWKDGIQYQ